MGQIFNPVAPALGVNRLLFSLIGANMNTTADQALVAAFGFTNYIIDRIIAMNASTSLTLAAGGIYTAASKGGTAVVANTQLYSALTGATPTVPLTLNSTSLRTTGLILALTTAQGGAATADIMVFGFALT